MCCTLLSSRRDELIDLVRLLRARPRRRVRLSAERTVLALRAVVTLETRLTFEDLAAMQTRERPHLASHSRGHDGSSPLVISGATLQVTQKRESSLSHRRTTHRALVDPGSSSIRLAVSLNIVPIHLRKY